MGLCEAGAAQSVAPPENLFRLRRILIYLVATQQRRRLMTPKTLAVALALTLAPTLCLAEGCAYGKHEQQAMSCAAGSTYDAVTHSCVLNTG